ncbi:uncharacterized protein LOC125740607 isoform X1 [Brienomyrus brachyistius]|uniref:uncharacterized protein LOC125740607 isoform X1 n=1 Tax=Brienomyrus brachyistius TaxID=42636 RepID=UPI0020B28232|nr:uncharacterized protein LOC125740607 isoform X1 [Brienomyrus brachyistius]XP_048867961.1 uncharacterized protein LOC125740607 isoform X1 [Brienomyrus brachyistius]XP_048867962.1 uncharacterized protein LOC125740607 isoform X1 [Brienomyrus brachyistius]XP_048867963.1 uncharacterized protein LOC125740607 isoform X1 [Brienomyrus brachyistius]XP_048867964.1 uncharacterized protein LOC125740607 isoform X1 [Brienomyrus brachyistius]XP_048867965.1 uncharacterized protein LOC125740607 isoform X1 [B
MAAASTEVGGRTTEREGPLHILTVNVRGLKTNGKKLKSIISEVDIVFLAETHVEDGDAWKDYEKDWKIFFTCCDPRCKGCFRSKLKNGTAILLNNKRNFKYCLPEIVDGSGRYVIVSCWISGRLCTFVCVYHHRKQKGLLKELSEKIIPPYTDILVVGGNFKTALDKVKDRTNKSNNSVHNRIRKELYPFLDEHDLIDAWRKKNPDKEEYTYENTWEKVRSDYFFINADKWELVQDCSINKENISGHWSVSLILDLKDQTRELKIFSSTVHDLPRDEVLTELCSDIILLTKGEAEHEDYINKIKEEEGKTNWIVVWSDHSNAAILVTKRRGVMHILFTVYHKNYVILHCRVLGMLHTFVSACNPTENNLKNMLREILSNRSGRIVIGGDFSTSEQRIMELMEENEFKKPEGEYMKSHYLIHAPLGQANKIHPRIYFLKQQDRRLSWKQWVQVGTNPGQGPTRTQPQDQLRNTNQPAQAAFELCGGAEAPGENPLEHEENVQTARRKFQGELDPETITPHYYSQPSKEFGKRKKTVD